jgi:hypothetical protein
MPLISAENLGFVLITEGEATVAENHRGDKYPDQQEAGAEHDLNQREGHGGVR